MLPRSKYAKAFMLSGGADDQATLEDPELFTLHYNGGAPYRKQVQMQKNGLWYLSENQDCVA